MHCQHTSTDCFCLITTVGYVAVPHKDFMPEEAHTCYTHSKIHDNNLHNNKRNIYTLPSHHIIQFPS